MKKSLKHYFLPILLLSTSVYGDALKKDADQTGDKALESATLDINKPQKKDKTMIKTASGLGIEILTDSDGVMPQKGQTIKAHYTGWLTDGTKFDSSHDRGQPLQFKVGVGQVIAGWDEGLLAMKVGQKVKLYIPSELGYGARGAGGAIPPHADLVFEVELVSIVG